MKKNQFNNILRTVSALLWGISAVSASLLLFWLFRLDLLPKMYFLGISLLFSVIFALMGFLIFPKKRKGRFSSRRGRGLTALFLSAALCAACLFGAAVTHKLYATLSAITGAETQHTVLEVYVRADDPAVTIEDTGGYRFALADSTEEADSQALLSELEQLLSAPVTPAHYPNAFALVSALYAGETDAIILDSAYASVLETVEGYTDFADQTRLLYDYVIEKQAAPSPSVNQPTPGTPFLLYLSGNDARRQLLADGGSDVNILVAVNPEAKQILLVNTPRDYYVVNPASGDGSRDKLSHCGLNGISNCVGAMETLYGQHINYYARINFSGFRTLVDALGGVTIYSDRAFTAGGYPIREGENFLNGDQALAFARERMNLPGGDNDRGKNQMKLIAAMVEKLSAGTLLLKYGDILDSLEGMFSTSMPAQAISALVQRQLEDGASWEILSFAVTGDNGNDRCWAVGGGYGYVMYPHENMVSHAASLLERVLKGEALTGEDLKIT